MTKNNFLLISESFSSGEAPVFHESLGILEASGNQEEDLRFAAQLLYDFFVDRYQVVAIYEIIKEEDPDILGSIIINMDGVDHQFMVSVPWIHGRIQDQRQYPRYFHLGGSVTVGPNSENTFHQVYIARGYKPHAADEKWYWTEVQSSKEEEDFLTGLQSEREDYDLFEDPPISSSSQ